MNKKYLISVLVILTSLLAISKYLQNKNLNDKILIKKIKPISKIVIGKIYVLNQSIIAENFNILGNQTYLKLVDQKHWIMVINNFNDNKYDNFPSLQIIEGTYQKIEMDYLFDLDATELKITFANKENAVKNIYFASQLKNISNIFDGLIFKNEKYTFNNRVLYAGQGRIPNSIEQYLKYSKYNPAVPTYSSKCFKNEFVWKI